MQNLLQHVHPVLSHREAVGHRFSSTELIASVRSVDWREAIAKLCLWSAILDKSASMPSGTLIRAFTTDLLKQFSHSASSFERNIARYVSYNDKRPLVSQPSIHFLVATFLHHGSDSKIVPDDSLLTFLLLAANDYSTEWECSSGTGSTDALMASAVHGSVFHQHPDPLMEIVRAHSIYTTPPNINHPLASKEEFARLQQEAFGMSSAEYFSTCLTPIFILSQGWGREGDKSGENVSLPQVRSDLFTNSFCNGAADQEKFLHSISIDAETAKRSIRLDSSSMLPLRTSIFFNYPLIRFNETESWAVSPSLVRDLLFKNPWHLMVCARPTTPGKMAIKI